MPRPFVLPSSRLTLSFLTLRKKPKTQSITNKKVIMRNNNFFSKSLTNLLVFIIVSFCRPLVKNELDDSSPTLKVVH